MITEDIIFNLLGQEYLSYVMNKNRGGRTNEKGNSFENFFAVYKIAELFSISEEHHEKVIISSQELLFVDDLIIDDGSREKISHFQLKNAQSVSWGNEFKTLSDDFRVQIQLNESINRECECYLVISNKDLLNDLKVGLPESIKKNTQVLFFAYDPMLNKVLSNNTEFYSAVKEICAIPERDKIESVAANILGAWIASGKKNVTIKSILEESTKLNPSYIRPLGVKFSLKPQTIEILNNIKDFRYNIDRGFLVWDYKNHLESGILPYSCITDKFEKFEKLLSEHNPKDFTSIETFLI